MTDSYDDNNTPRFKETLSHLWSNARGSLSLCLAYTCAAVFVLTFLLDLLNIVSSERVLVFLGLSHVGLFERFWLHQLLTAAFVHSGIFQLLFNVMALIFFGPQIEQLLGRRRFVTLLLLCLYSSTLGFLLFNWTGPGILHGPAGVIFGLLVAQAIYFPDTKIPFFIFFRVKMKYAVLIMAAIALYLSINSAGSSNAHLAQLFAAAAAFIYLKTIQKRDDAKTRPVPKKRPKQKRRHKTKTTSMPKEL